MNLIIQIIMEIMNHNQWNNEIIDKTFFEK